MNLQDIQSMLAPNAKISSKIKVIAGRKVYFAELSGVSLNPQTKEVHIEYKADVPAPTSRAAKVKPAKK